MTAGNKEQGRSQGVEEYSPAGRSGRGRVGRLAFVMLLSPLFLAAGSPEAADEQEPPDEIEISNEGYRTDRKGPVPFDHLTHAEDYDAECADCHHDYQDGENVWEEGARVEGCSACHSPLEDQGNAKKLRTAFHLNCKGCHRTLLREGVTEDAPFKSCYHCHERTS